MPLQSVHDEDSSSYMRGLIDGLERARLEQDAQPPGLRYGAVLVPAWWLAFLAGICVLVAAGSTVLVMTRLDNHAELLGAARLCYPTDVAEPGRP
jgi:hypothetical protein